jgi:hypothetical protein
MHTPFTLWMNFSHVQMIRITDYYYYYYYYYYYWYSALGLVWAETRVQSGDWYDSGTLQPGQVLRGSLPLLSPLFRCSHFSPLGASTSATT